MLYKILTFLKDIIAPKRCYSCKKEGHFLCPKCLSQQDLFFPMCYVCKKSSPHFSIHEKCKKTLSLDSIIVLVHYKIPLIKKLIKNAKFYGKKDILNDFGSYLAKGLNKNIQKDEIKNTLLVATPMHFMRRYKRGYNQAEVLASVIAKNIDIDYRAGLMQKSKNTPQQSKFSKQERIQNLQNSFCINKKYRNIIDKKIIILVDDVVSTGSTLNEMAKLLKKHGAKKVIGLVIASD